MIKIKQKHYKVNLENPIKRKKDDIFGYDYEIRRIKNAIRDEANVIGIISEYGSGKSSLIQLLNNKLCFFRYKVIKVNLWDNKLKIINQSSTNNIPSEESIIRLHKTFLRQVSSQTRKFNSVYINRRINANYGAAKISFPSYFSLLKWFLIYVVLLVGLLYVTCKFGFNISSYNSISLDDKKNFITFLISKISTIIIGFAFFYIIFNKEVLFSFWNNSKSREITEEDTIQIYNELFGKKIKFLPRLRKIVIIIEDLDRIEKEELVEFYLNEFYRLYIEGNEKNRNGITMIFCLKDNKKNSCESKYIKIFDYISYINQINIDDKEEVLKQIIIRDDLLYDLSFNSESKKIDVSKLSWLTYGQKLNIRTIKRRIEHFKNIYLMISSRGISKKNKKGDLDINLTTCSFVAYLKTEYNSGLDYILSEYDLNGSNFIDRYVNKKIIGEIINRDNIEFTDKDSENIKEVKKLIVSMINSGYIDSQYKKYFYNFPKGTKIYTTTEKYVSDFITNNSMVDKDNIINVIKTFREVEDNFIYDRINSVNSLGKDMPNICIYESKCFKSAQQINKDKLINKLNNLLSLNDTNVDKVCNTINLLKESNIDKKELSILISSIINENVKIENIELEEMYKFRNLLIDCFGTNILNFDELYKKVQISKKEIENISDIDTIISVAQLVTHDDDIDSLISKQFDNIKTNNKNDYIFKLIDTFSNWKSIYNIDVSNFKNDTKEKIYSKICNSNISNNEKIELLLYLDYINIKIAEEFTLEDDIDDKLMINYLNKQKKCSEKIIQFVDNSNKLFDISDTIFNSLKIESEKYHAYYIYKNHTISETCNDNMKSNLFLKYSEITIYLGNEKIVKILKKQKTYKKLDSTNVTKDKIIVLASVQQTKEMVKSIIENNNIYEEIKCYYLENIKSINADAAKYISFLISSSTPVELLKSINKNKKNLFLDFNRFYKANITKELKKLI